MKPFIFSILFLISSSFAFSQTEEVIIKKSFKANENTTLNLDLDNVSIIFEESFDDKIHVDYSIFFGKYSKRKRDIIKKQSTFKVDEANDLINLTVKNSMFLGEIYKVDVRYEDLLISMKDYINEQSEKEYNYKSKDAVLKEIGFSEGDDIKNFIKKNADKYRTKTDFEKKKVIVQKFTIKLPKNVAVRLKALYSNITFKYDITKPINVNSYKGYYRFKKLISDKNNFIISSGILESEEIKGGNYNLKDVDKFLIGSISDANIISETSTLEIGEIAKNVIFTDFNSKLYLYNFNKNFTKFNLKGDYSELNLYKVKDTNFSMDVFGFNTTLNMNDTKTTFGSLKDEKMTKILEKKRKENIPFLGNIEIELKNGIINLKQ